jgi:hypothetical protein
MRGSKLQGRFNIDYEASSMYEGIDDDLTRPVGNQVDWFRWQDYYLQENYTTIVDDVYDVASSVATQGRRWMLPFKMPVVMAQFVRGTNVMNQRGFYVTDTLRLVLNVGDVNRLLPDLLKNPNSHIKDRIAFKGEVFIPTRVLPRGFFENKYTLVTIDCNQLNPEELVNDPQFQTYALPSKSDARTIGYGYGSYGSDPYGE